MVRRVAAISRGTESGDGTPTATDAQVAAQITRETLRFVAIGQGM